jgi:HCO3- transporter family
MACGRICRQMHVSLLPGRSSPPALKHAAHHLLSEGLRLHPEGLWIHVRASSSCAGPQLFLAWAAWACVWAAIMILALTAAGACRYIHLFTRFSGELFGALIAVRPFHQRV